MSCVCSKYYVEETPRKKTEMKAYALDDKFHFNTKEWHYPGYTVRTSLEIGRAEAKKLIGQLQEFVSQGE